MGPGSCAEGAGPGPAHRAPLAGPDVRRRRGTVQRLVDRSQPRGRPTTSKRRGHPRAAAMISRLTGASYDEAGPGRPGFLSVTDAAGRSAQAIDLYLKPIHTHWVVPS